MLLSSNMEKEILCKNILKDLNKKEVGVKVSQEIKGNYYSYLHNCIYLNNKKSCDNQEMAKESVVIAHECIHAKQSKTLHLSNVILSNLELLLFVLFVILCVTFKTILTLKIICIIFCILSLSCRCVLEIPAMINSFDLVNKYSNNEIKELILKDKEKIKYLMPIGILSFSWFRILRLVLIILM